MRKKNETMLYLWDLRGLATAWNIPVLEKKNRKGYVTSLYLDPEKPVAQKEVINTVALWFEKGFRDWQKSETRSEAFAPISSHIGTSRESMSYIDDLAKVVKELTDGSHVKSKFVDPAIGDVFAQTLPTALGCTVEKIAATMGDDNKNRSILVDSLMVLAHSDNRRIWKDCLPTAWRSVRDIEKENITAGNEEKWPFFISGQFVQYAWHVCEVGQGDKVSFILDDVAACFEIAGQKKIEVPEIIREDLKACYTSLQKNAAAATRG